VAGELVSVGTVPSMRTCWSRHEEMLPAPSLARVSSS